MLILDALRSTVLASVIFGLIPVGWWRIKGRKQAGFAAYFGLIRPQKNKSAGRMIVVYWLVWAFFYAVYPALCQRLYRIGYACDVADYDHQLYPDRLF